jgi:hypothetical protein
MGELSFALSVFPRAHLSVGFYGDVTVLPTTIADRSGSASARADSVGGELAWAFGNESWPLRPDIGLRGGATLLHLEGSANAPDIGAVTNLWNVDVAARVGVSMRIVPSLRVRADGALGVVAPGASVLFAGTQVATWSFPLLSASAGLELDVGGRSK